MSQWIWLTFCKVLTSGDKDLLWNRWGVTQEPSPFLLLLITRLFGWLLYKTLWDFCEQLPIMVCLWGNLLWLLPWAWFVLWLNASGALRLCLFLAEHQEAHIQISSFFPCTQSKSFLKEGIKTRKQKWDLHVITPCTLCCPWWHRGVVWLLLVLRKDRPCSLSSAAIVSLAELTR